MKRLLSLDVFRGMTVALMILVNNPGCGDYVFAPLLHSKWDGLTPTDLVFPFFLFIVGVSTFFSLNKFNFELNSKTVYKIVKRGFLIYLIGLILNWFPFFNQDLSHLRLIGVLHRIGLAYMFGGLIACALKSTGKIISVTAILLIGYWIILGVFGGDNINGPFSLEGNLVKKIDLAFFGENHVYHGYGIPFDPEGLLSTIPAIGTVLLGFLTGKFLAKATIDYSRLFKLQTIGAALVVASLIINAWLPINKPLWSSSYVLCCAGLAMIVLSVLAYIIDILNYKNWTSFFTVFGTNALFIYAFSEVFAISCWMIQFENGDKTISLQGLVYQTAYQPIFGNHLGSLMLAITYILIFWLVASILYKKKIIIKI